MLNTLVEEGRRLGRRVWAVSLFCRHKWKVLSDKVLESPFVQVAKANLNIKAMRNIPDDMFTRKSVTILGCELCGKIRKFVEVHG